MKMKIDIFFTNTAWYEYLEWLEKDKIVFTNMHTYTIIELSLAYKVRVPLIEFRYLF